MIFKFELRLAFISYVKLNFKGSLSCSKSWSEPGYPRKNAFLWAAFYIKPTKHSMKLRRGSVSKPRVVELRHNNQSVCVDEYSRMCLSQVLPSSVYILEVLMSATYRTLLIKVHIHKWRTVLINISSGAARKFRLGEGGRILVRQTHLPPNSYFSSDFGLFILKILKNLKNG